MADLALLFGLLLVGLRVPLAHAQLALPVEMPAATIPISFPNLNYEIDLDTLPLRPAILVSVTPFPGHEDIELEVVIDDFQGSFNGGGACPESSTTVTSLPFVGAFEYRYSLTTCSVDPSDFAGNTLDVNLRVLDFGSGGAPATIAVSIRGETRIVTGSLDLELETDVSTKSLILSPSKDTVIYDLTQDASNGQGISLWSGTDFGIVGLNPPLITRDPVRSLLAFDLVDDIPFNPIPFNSTISNVGLELYVMEVLGGGGLVYLYQTAPDPTGETWAEGAGDQPGNEFVGTSTAGSGANWIHRRTPTVPWSTPGGDLVPGTLASLDISSSGWAYFASPGLDAAVQNMLDFQEDGNGFVLSGPFDFFAVGDQAVRYASRENLPTIEPRLYLDYTPTGPYVEEILATTAVSYVNEGEDFRWIYGDTNDVLVTEVGGVCSVIDLDPNEGRRLPINYVYQGDPTYEGVDCCLWQISSMASGTIGTGDAVFYINVDGGDPANQPPDFDGDGIRDPCDNCIYTPNGPALGSCVGPGPTGGPCLADSDCAAGDTCDKSQTESNDAIPGDACDAPEPATGLGLSLGAGLLSVLAERRRARRQVPW